MRNCVSWLETKIELIKFSNKVSNIDNYCVIIYNLRAQFKRVTRACYKNHLELIQNYLIVNSYDIFGSLLKAKICIMN